MATSSEKSALFGPPPMSNVKGKAGTGAPPCPEGHIEYTANLPHQLVATMGTTAGDKCGCATGHRLVEAGGTNKVL